MSTFVSTVVASDDLTPVQAYAALRAALPGRSSFLFESAAAGERWGRYSIVGCRVKSEGVYPGNTFGMLDQDVAALPEAKNLAEALCGAFVGYIAYDAVHPLHGVDAWEQEGSHARMMRGSTVLVFDNVDRTLTIAGVNENVIARVRDVLAKAPALTPLPALDPNALPEHVDATIDDATYAAKVRRAKEYVAAGDVTQVVLARRFSIPQRDADPFVVYRAMRALSPSPYLYYLEFAESPFAKPLVIAGTSPETLVRIDGDTITLRPIAGTRRRGADDDVDRLADELSKDPKARAEHERIVELTRGDVERVCEPGSIEVTRSMEIERGADVVHMVSEVTGRPRPDVKAGELVRAAFPAGVLTGSPKARATRIIRELEIEPRDVYGGAIGYFAAGRRVDLAMANRTIVLRNGIFEVPAGAAIALDSDPEREADETRAEAKRALAAIRAAEDVASSKV